MRSLGPLPFPRIVPLLLTAATLWSVLAPSTLAFSSAGALALILLVGTAIPCSDVLARFQRRRRDGDDTVALTFDDGPDPELTPGVLDLLRVERIQATFFVVGEKARAHPDLVRRAVGEGHQVGNHSWDHRWWHNLRSRRSLQVDLEEASAAVEDACGVRPVLYRPPYGLVSPSTRAVVDALGLRLIGWNVRGLDYGNRRVTGTAETILERVRAGDIVLLHDGLPRGGSAEPVLGELRTLIRGLRERGHLADDRTPAL